MSLQNSLKFRTKLSLGFGCLLILMTLVSAIVYKNLDRLNENSHWVDHTNKVIQTIDGCGRYLIDMETGMRGFLLTGNDEFLEPFEMGVNLFQETWEKGRTLTINNPPQTQRWDNLLNLKETWLLKIATLEIEMRREVRSGKAATDEFLRVSGRIHGKKIFDKLRKQLSSIQNTLLENNDHEGADLVNLILIDLLNQETGKRGFLLSGQEESLEPYKDGKTSFEFHFKELENFVKNNQGIGILQLSNISSLVNQWHKESAELEINARRKMNTFPRKMEDVTKLLESGKGKRYMDQMRTLMSEMIGEEKALLAIRAKEAAATSRTTNISILLGTLLAIITGVVMAFFIVSKTMQDLGGEPSEIAFLANRVAQGDLSMGADEITKSKYGIHGSLLRMIRNLNEVVAQADAVSRGDYTQKVEPLSEYDELGIALARMASTLREVAAENERESILKTGQAELNDRLRGEIDKETLLTSILSYLATFLRAQVGAFYLADSDGTFILEASYAYQKRKALSNKFHLGEGLVCQAAKEKEPIIITEVPDDYIYISSGLGSSPPQSILVFPLMYLDEIKGVIELGSTEILSDKDFAFLELVGESIAIAIASSDSRQRMRELLEKTQIQAKELQSQQDELRQTNDVLENQKESLVASEARLQAQQEELRQTNEELQEQTQQLEEQKKSIEETNLELEITKTLIEEKANDLEQTSKYKSEFLANMSHELRTPLNSILLLSNLMSDNKDANLTPKQKEYSTTIHSSGTELLELINDILDLSKVESGKMEIHLETLRLKDFADRMERTFIPQAQSKHLEMFVNIEEDLPSQIRTDRQRFEQIIKNLMSNALKFTKKGSVSLEVKRPKGIEDLDIVGLSPDTTIAFTVRDTGEGIAREKQYLVFEAFRQADGTTSRRYGGSGLGLAIAKEFTKLLGGVITLESTPGEGSAFTVYLPEKLSKDLASQTTEKVQPATRKSPPEHQSQRDIPSQSLTENEVFIPDDRNKITPQDTTILIIEDDPKFAQTLSDLARERDYKVLVAGDGETGLHFADFYNPNAIILDIGLPGMDGWSVMARLKEQSSTRHIPVHFISAFDNTVEAKKMGAIGFITKPVSMAMLDKAFGKIEHLISGNIKELLIVEDDKVQRKAMLELIGNGDVHTTEAATGTEALKLIRTKAFDCLILDLGLPDMSGVDFLSTMKEDDLITELPVIVYTGKDLTGEEQAIINEYAEKIIIKGAKSAEKLLDETTLFLHRVEENLPEEKRKMIRKIHSRESVFKNKTVLVVDDDMRNVYAVTSVLEERGLNIVAAKDGNDGVEVLKNNPDIDLVLMDIMMPEMNGYEAMRAIRSEERFRKIPIIALTAKAMKGDRKKCIEAGASDYLAKPVETDKLLSMLRVWLYG